jgi:hypothetical protein
MFLIFAVPKKKKENEKKRRFHYTPLRKIHAHDARYKNVSCPASP